MSRYMRQLIQTLWRDTRGTQVVEFAIVVPLLLMLTVGIIDFGRGFFSYIIITNGAREGARLAAVGGTANEIYTRVENAVTGLPIAGPPITVETPADCAALAAATHQAWCIQVDNALGLPGEEAAVRIEYNFQFLVPGIPGLTAGIFPIVAESTMRLEG